MESNSGTLIVLTILIVFAFLLILIRLAVFVNNFGREKQYLLSEMHRAADYNEYRYWRRELRCHYLCLIPFVSERNVLKIYRVFFRRAKHEEKRSDGILHILAPSVIGICICAVSLCGASWAWFTASTYAGTTAVKTPESYELTVISVTDSENQIIAANAAGNYSLSGGSYTVLLSAAGTSGATGYCGVMLDDKPYYTVQIFAGNTFKFTVTAAGAAEIILTPKWGSCAVRDESNAIVNDGGIAALQGGGETADNAANAAPSERSAAQDEPNGALPQDETAVEDISVPAKTDDETEKTDSSDETGGAETQVIENN